FTHGARRGRPRPPHCDKLWLLRRKEIVAGHRVALGQQSFGDPTAHGPEPDKSKISHKFCYQAGCFASPVLDDRVTLREQAVGHAAAHHSQACVSKICHIGNSLRLYPGCWYIRRHMAEARKPQETPQESSALASLGLALSDWFERWFPDAFALALAAAAVVAAASMLAGSTALETAQRFGAGF